MKKKECAKNLTFDTPSFLYIYSKKTLASGHVVSIRPKGPCKTGPFTFSFGPNAVLTVALLQSRLGLARRLFHFFE